MPYNRTHMGDLPEEEREGAETRPWGQEWPKREVERKIDGNVVNVHRGCS